MLQFRNRADPVIYACKSLKFQNELLKFAVNTLLLLSVLLFGYLYQTCIMSCSTALNNSILS